jgi:ketosteroid isomerase-like protein
VSQATIERLYAAFAKLDGDAMAACYAPDAVFDDEAFSLRGRAQIGAMWTMLCDAVKAKGRDVWKIETRDITERSAHWEATYRFSATGRMVHNVIDASFEFDAAGLIRRQRDRFDFWRWARQALGPPGVLLGWSPWLRNKVRAQAAKNLDRFIAARKET